MTEEATRTAERDARRAEREARQAQGGSRRDRESVGGDVVIEPGQTARDVTAVRGSVTLRPGAEGREVVAVLGDVNMEAGSSARQVVAIAGDVHVGPGASVERDAVAIGGRVLIDPAGDVGGQKVTIGVGALGEALRSMGLRSHEHERSGGFWSVAKFIAKFGVMLLLGFLLLTFFPRRIDAVSASLLANPGKSVLAGLLGLLAQPLLTLLLVVTVVGIPLVFVQVLGLGVAYLIGVTAVAVLIGRALPVALHRETGILQLAIGLLLVLLAVAVPFVGWLLWAAMVMATFGAVLRTRFGQIPVLETVAATVPPAPAADAAAGATAVRRVVTEPLPRNPLWAPKVAKEGLRSGLHVEYDRDAATRAITEVRDISYDLNSNLSTVTTWSPAGLATGKTCLVHDARNRLTAVGPALALESPGNVACKAEADLASVTVRFKYDARNRRVAWQDGAGTWKQWALLPDGSPLTESWKPTSSTGDWEKIREYVWLDGQPLAQVEYPGPTGRRGVRLLLPPRPPRPAAGADQLDRRDGLERGADAAVRGRGEATTTDPAQRAHGGDQPAAAGAVRRAAAHMASASRGPTTTGTGGTCRAWAGTWSWIRLRSGGASTRPSVSIGTATLAKGRWSWSTGLALTKRTGRTGAAEREPRHSLRPDQRQLGRHVLGWRPSIL